MWIEAWRIEAMHRQKKLPKLHTLLGKPAPKQSAAEMHAAMMVYAKRHNRKMN